MASAEARAKLASVARALNAANAPTLPPLILMTDEKRLPDPLAAARALPAGSAVIVRHTNDAERAKLALALAEIADERDQRLLIANDPELAEAVRASGVHFSEARIAEANASRAARRDWLITVAAHSKEAIENAVSNHADAVLLSPVFVTGSHPDSPPLGPKRFIRMARRAAIPVYALGGVNAENVEQLTGPNIAGISAIDALIPD